MTTPDSCDAAISKTRTTPVSRSTLTRAAWVKNVGAANDSLPRRPTQLAASTAGVGGGSPDPLPSSNPAPEATDASSAIETDAVWLPRTLAVPSTSSMSARLASR